VPEGRDTPPLAEVPDRVAREQATVARVVSFLGEACRNRLIAHPRRLQLLEPLPQLRYVSALAIPREVAGDSVLGRRARLPVDLEPHLLRRPSPVQDDIARHQADDAFAVRGGGRGGVPQRRQVLAEGEDRLAIRQ